MADWKEVEKGVKEHFPKLKLIYTRADSHGGDIALANRKALKVQNKLIAELTAKSLKILGKDFTFSITEGEALEEYWRKKGRYYESCFNNSLEMAKTAWKLC